MNGELIGEILKIVFTVAGGIIVGFVTVKANRRSQSESNELLKVNAIVDRYEKWLATEKSDNEDLDNENKWLRKQVQLWKRYTQLLRDQIYDLGTKPIEANEELEL